MNVRSRFIKFWHELQHTSRPRVGRYQVRYANVMLLNWSVIVVSAVITTLDRHSWPYSICATLPSRHGIDYKITRSMSISVWLNHLSIWKMRCISLHVVRHASYSQPHDNLLRVAQQKAIIIKDVKTAPAPGLPRTGPILISRSRLIHAFFVQFWSFFSRERFPCESFKEMAYWVSYRSRAYLRDAIDGALRPENARHMPCAPLLVEYQLLIYMSSPVFFNNYDTHIDLQILLET